jgi:hypothetical protein
MLDARDKTGAAIHLGRQLDAGRLQPVVDVGH